ncbi:MAG: ATP-binding protein, partial [Mycetocola sp.]
MGRVRVIAAADHLDRFISSPRAGLLELVWNALDADADEVHVDLQLGGLGGIEALSVRDNGTGLPADRAENEFGALGGSWKRLAQSTPKGRALHGRLGGGRFAAYGLGH